MENGIRLHQAQYQNPIIRQVIAWIRSGSVPPKAAIPRYEECLFKYRNQFERLVIKDGLLCRRKGHPSGAIVHQLVIPHSLIPKVLSILHSSPSALHFGTSKTIELFEELCYWHGMRKDIAELCSHCQACNSYRTSLFPPSSLPHACAVISHPSSPFPPPTSSPSDTSTDPLLHSPVPTCPPPNPPNVSDIPTCTDDVPVFTSHPPVSADIDLPSPPPSPSLPSPASLLETVVSNLDSGYVNDYQYHGYNAECDTSCSPSTISPISSRPNSPDFDVATCQFHWSLFRHSRFETSFQDHPLTPAATSSPQPPATPHIPSHDVHAHNHDPVTRTRSGRAVRPPEYYGNHMPPHIP